MWFIIVKTVLAALVAALVGAALPINGAEAGTFEVSLGFSFNQRVYSEDSKTWSRKWGASLGYNFSDYFGVEIAFQDAVERNNIAHYENTTFHDRVYSASWMQYFVNRKFPVQPYVKLGVGLLNREATGTYWYGASPPLKVDSITGIGALGLRIYITRYFAIRTEISTYLAGGYLRKWKDHIDYTLGVSVFF
ncbi:MAG: hypothetical protein A2583_10510 [Bdellovibrionales bacterium RIFOXYD1_FULL_53_11]|nr:MAG: hypothetical protein A2583_10510 [Bdellovibrionales bacterium RIFOXYD1_FULL_53_11]